jgi:hypothetical protein
VVHDDSRELARITVFSWSVIATLAVVLAVVAWLSWPGPDPGEPPRARQYRDYDLCLLTDGRGIQAQPASEVWQGLQQVSLETRAKVTFLPVTGEQTQAVAAQIVATQVQQQCDIIVAVGEPQTAAVASAAGKYPQVKFVTVGAPDGGSATGPNLSNVSSVQAGPVAAHVRPMVP